jgi:lysophospholipase L1-like esterase
MSRARLATLGDSFVAGHGDEDPEGRRLGWVSRFAWLLDLPAQRLVNLGSYGATTQDVVAEQLAAALVNKPPLVGVMVGVNDLLGDYRTERFRVNVASIFAAMCGADTMVFTATYPEVPRVAPLPGPIREVVRRRFVEANGLLRQLAEDYGVLCLDIAMASQWREADMWSADGLHPGPKGHQRFAEDMAELVVKAMGTGMGMGIGIGTGASAGGTW